MDQSDRIDRVIDANANRAREALRVMEDLARFILDDAALTERTKAMTYWTSSLMLRPSLGSSPPLRWSRRCPLVYLETGARARPFSCTSCAAGWGS